MGLKMFEGSRPQKGHRGRASGGEGVVRKAQREGLLSRVARGS